MSSKEPYGWSGACTHSPLETRRAGAEFATYLRPGEVVALHGELGSGKTTFIKGIAEALGLDDPVSSPTFALIHEYGDPPELYHLDCYRETALERWELLGLADYFDDEVVSVIEWAEIIGPLLPERAIHVTLSHGADENERLIEVAQ